MRCDDTFIPGRFRAGYRLGFKFESITEVQGLDRAKPQKHEERQRKATAVQPDVCGWTYVRRLTKTIVHALFMDAVKIVVPGTVVTVFAATRYYLRIDSTTVRKVRMIDRSFVLGWNIGYTSESTRHEFLR